MTNHGSNDDIYEAHSHDDNVHAEEYVTPTSTVLPLPLTAPRLKGRSSLHKTREPIVCRGSAERQVELHTLSLPFCHFPGPNTRSSRWIRYPRRRSYHTPHILLCSTGPV